MKSIRLCRTLLLGILLWLPDVLNVCAQENGTVIGVVVSAWDATPLSGVAVTLRGTTLATQADAGGRFELKNVPPGNQILRFSKSGFGSAVVTDVRVLPGQTTTVNGNLRPEFYEMEEYEITAEEFVQQTEKILIERQQASSLMDAIGSEQFSKLGAGDAGAIVAKVTGVSIVGGKYAVVRGLDDRYTRTLLNGVEVPSADPYRSSPQLDLFPSAMIDRINVSKTFLPDQLGASAGGVIDIVTKAFPEKPFIKATVGTSFNPESNLKKNFLSDPDSSMSMFHIPSGPKPLNPDLFGLNNENRPRPPGPAVSRETTARAILRRQQADATQGLMQELGPANFAGVSQTSPLNTSMSASAGRTISLFGRPLGMFAGVNYSRNYKLLEEFTVRRYSYLADPDGFLTKDGRETRGNILTDYGANVNLGLDLSEYAQFGFNFMLAHNSDEEARRGVFNTEGQDTLLKQWQLHYTEREIMNYQLHGHHLVPFLADSKIDWVVGLANTSQNEPDQRFMNYFESPQGQVTFGDASLPSPQFPARYFREIEEESMNYKLDWTLPLAFMKEESKLKAGLFSSRTERKFREQYFAYQGDSGFNPANPNSYLNDPAYLQYTATHIGGIRTNFSFARYVIDTASGPYSASLDVKAGYVMADLGLLRWLRVLGGMRYEKTLMEIDAREGLFEIDQTDLLPGAGVVFTLVTNCYLRLGYGETVARPSFREKAPIFQFLPDIGVTAVGNANLQMSAINSYDARLEWFPSAGDVFTVGAFYKEITRPIELYSRSFGDSNLTWDNRTNGVSTVMGVEFEARKSLGFLASELNGLTVGANIALIESKVTLTDNELDNKTGTDPHPSRTRPLYSQSPYIINLDLSYAHPTSGTSLALGANLTGERIVFATSQGPDIYEHPPITVDASISQKFWKNWTARFGVQNILDENFQQTYGPDAGGNIFQSYKKGRTFSLSLTAEF